MSIGRKVLGSVLVVGLVVVAGLVGWRVAMEWRGMDEGEEEVALPAAVELAEVVRGPIELRRSFSGALEASSSFVLSAKVGGRIERIAVDLGDAVENGSVVVELDGDEYEQALARAEADLAVAEATLSEAKSVLAISERALERETRLHERGVASDAQLDEAAAARWSSAARLAVAEAGVARASAAVATAETQLGYTRVEAVWEEGGERVVAERMVEAGDTVSANAPLLRIVGLDPLRAVVFVAERDYGRLVPGLPVVLRTDAYRLSRFSAEVARVSPVFESSSRQARVELRVPNEGGRLRPGMFVRAETTLEVRESVLTLPAVSVVEREGGLGVFVFEAADGGAEAGVVRWQPVALGIEDAGRVEVSGEGLSAGMWVVTLGQPLLDDGLAARRVGDEVENGDATGEAAE